MTTNLLIKRIYSQRKEVAIRAIFLLPIKRGKRETDRVASPKGVQLHTILTFLSAIGLTIRQCYTHTGFKEVVNKLEMSLLSSFHKWCTASQLNISPSRDQEISHVQEATTAGQGESRLLSLLSLGIDISI